MLISKYWILLFVIIGGSTAYSQNTSGLDSLWKLYSEQTDTAKFDTSIEIANQIYASDPEKIFGLLNEMLDYASGFDDKQREGDALGWLGFLCLQKGEFEKGLEYQKRALIIRLKAKDKAAIGSVYSDFGELFYQSGQTDSAIKYFDKSIVYRIEGGLVERALGSINNLGYVYYQIGNIEEAIAQWDRGLRLLEDHHANDWKASLTNNIASVYYSQGNIEKATEYWETNLTFAETIGDSLTMMTSLQNLGKIKVKNKEYDVALANDLKAKHYFESTNNMQQLVDVLNDLGSLYSILDSNGLSEASYKQALPISEEIRYGPGLAETYKGYSRLSFKQNDLENAKLYGEKAYYIFEQLGIVEDLSTCSDVLYQSYKKEGNWKNALKFHEIMVEMRDSIVNKENLRASVNQQYSYEYALKTKADSIAQQAKIEVKNAEIRAEKVKSEKQRQQKVYLMIVLLILVLFAAFIYNRFKISQRQKKTIEIQKKSVETQKEKIEQQHEQLEEVHQEINDSIRYAEGLQLAILPSQETLKENLKDGFVYFKPKDVVSGDFYWMQKVGETILFAAADCTGHGVPGAMVSVVCSNALNRSVKEFGLTSPSAILDKTRELVIETFARSGDNVRDGMDIALCKLEGREMTFCGANNPLWIVRETTSLTPEQLIDKSNIVLEGKSLIEYKANRQPIGNYVENKPFFEEIILLEKGDNLYIFTDGYADQFGGEKGKKLKYKAFKRLLIELNNQTMDAQRDMLEAAFSSWKGDFEQVDDVCIIGVRV